MIKSIRSSLHSLVDRGANGGVVGIDVRVIKTYPDRKVNIQSHAITLVAAGGATTNIIVEDIAIMHQYACHGKNKTINYSPQIEHYKNTVYDLSIKVGGS